MQIDDVKEVVSKTLVYLHRHFEAAWMPDEAYVQLTEVSIAAGTSIVAESGYLPSEIEKFERSLRQQAKDQWLESCAKNVLPEKNLQDALLESATEYDKIMKQLRKPKRRSRQA